MFGYNAFRRGADNSAVITLRVMNAITRSVMNALGRGRMENQTMGRVLTNAKIVNVYDLHDAERGVLTGKQVRRIEITDALVDTVASTQSLPRRLIDQLGLKSVGTQRAPTRSGVALMNKFGTVRLTLMDREWTGDGVELPDDCPVLIGQQPLEALDLVVDMGNHRLIGNPAHGGEYIIDMF
jgi:predicted aspartyl protease